MNKYSNSDESKTRVTARKIMCDVWCLIVDTLKCLTLPPKTQSPKHQTNTSQALLVNKFDTLCFHIDKIMCDTLCNIHTRSAIILRLWFVLTMLCAERNAVRPSLCVIVSQAITNIQHTFWLIECENHLQNNGSTEWCITISWAEFKIWGKLNLVRNYGRAFLVISDVFAIDLVKNMLSVCAPQFSRFSDFAWNWLFWTSPLEIQVNILPYTDEKNEWKENGTHAEKQTNTDDWMKLSCFWEREHTQVQIKSSKDVNKKSRGLNNLFIKPRLLLLYGVESSITAKYLLILS